MISTGNKKQQSKGQKNSLNKLNFNQEMLSNEHQRSIPQHQQFGQQRRKSDKNKFINKLKQFQKKSNSDNRTGPHSQPYSAAFSQETGSRKERNKIAARQSRDRKKLYVQLMEGKIERLQNEIQETVKSIEKVRFDIYKVEMREGSQGKETNHRQMHIIKKMEGLLENQSLEQRNNELNICLDSIIYRIGALGKQRKAALSKLYFDLLNFSQPALYRYIMWSATKHKDLFGQTHSTEEEKWCKEIEQITQEVIQDENNQKDLHQIGERIACHSHHFKKSAEDLVNFRKQIERKGHLLDDSFNELREIFSPQQIARMILFVEKYQFKKQVRLFEEDNVEELGRPQKKVKTSEQQSYFQF